MKKGLLNICILSVCLSLLSSVGVFAAEDFPHNTELYPFTSSKVQAGRINWADGLDSLLPENAIGLGEGMDVTGLVDLVSLPGVEITASDWNSDNRSKPVAVHFLASGDYWLYKGGTPTPHWLEINFNRAVNIKYIQSHADGHAVINGGWGDMGPNTQYQLSMDGENWTTFADGSASQQGYWYNIVPGNTIQTKYLRIYAKNNANIGVEKLRVWGTAEDNGKEWIDLERKWGQAQGAYSSNSVHAGDGAFGNAVVAAGDLYSGTYSLSKAPASGNVYIQFNLSKSARLSRARLVVNEIYTQSAQNFTIYGSVENNSGDFIKLAEVGSIAPLKFGEFNYIDLDCPIDIRYITIIKNDGDTSEGALSFVDVKFEEDTSKSGEFAVYRKVSDGKSYALGDTAISTCMYRNMTSSVIDEAGTYTATFTYYSKDVDHNVHPLVGLFDEEDRLKSYTQIKTLSGTNWVDGAGPNTLKTYLGEVELDAGVSAIKCFATAKASNTGDTPVIGAPFAGAGKVAVEIGELID